MLHSGKVLKRGGIPGMARVPIVGPDSALLLLRFLLKIRSVRILDTICSRTLLWLFSPAWDAVKLTLHVGFICPFVVVDPTDLGATIVVAKALCLTIFNLSPTQKTCLFTDGNKASVCDLVRSAGGRSPLGGQGIRVPAVGASAVVDCTLAQASRPTKRAC